MKKNLLLLLVLTIGVFRLTAQDQNTLAFTDFNNSEYTMGVGYSSQNNTVSPAYDLLANESMPEGIGATTKFYTVVRFHKIEPGKREEYLKRMESVKTLFQMRKDKGEVRYWNVFKRTFPSGTESEYDYITSMGFDTGEQMEAYDKLTTSDLVKGLSHEDASRIENMGDVTKILRREVYVFQTSLPEGKNGKYLRVGGIKVNTGMSKDYEKMIETTIPVVSEGAKSGKLTNRTSWKRCFPVGADLNDYTVVTEYENMTSALNSVGSDFKAEYMKIYPKTDYDAEVKKFNQMRSQMWSELWERVMSTK